MLDQNTTTVLTTLITVFGTLGGVALGVVLSNRYVARQEKTKRNTAVIEETYTLLTNISARIVENISNQQVVTAGMRDNLDRVETLIYLYLPSLKGEYNIYEFYISTNCKSL